MDINSIVNSILGAGLLVIGWLARELWAAVKQLKEDLNTLQIKIGTDYVRYDRLQDALKPIMEALGEIKLGLSQKVDK